MNSETMTCQAPASADRQGRSRALLAYQASTSCGRPDTKRLCQAAQPPVSLRHPDETGVYRGREMSAVVRPSGPLPPRVYWTRRILLLVVLALLLAGLLQCVGGSDAPPPAGSGAVEPAAETSASVAPEDRRRRRRPPAALRERVRTVSAGFRAARQPCDHAAVRVTPQVVGRTHVAEPVPIQLRISATSADPCLLRLDAASLLVAVTSGEDPVWSSAGCQSAVPVRSLAVQPRWSTVVEIVWSGRRVGEECAAGRQVPPGAYTVQAAMVEGEPAAVDFEMGTERVPERQHRDDDTRRRSQT